MSSILPDKIEEIEMRLLHHIAVPLLILVSCTTLNEGTLRDLPLEREYVITVLRVIDDRLPSLSEDEFQDMLDRTRAYIREYLGYDVKFFLKANLGLLEFMRSMEFIRSSKEMAELKKSLLDPDDPGDRERLRSSIRNLVEGTDESVLRDYIPGYGNFKSRRDLSEHLCAQYVRKLNRIRLIATKKGALADPPYEEALTYPFWELALRHLKGSHFIFTNTIMADMELDIPIYVVLRFGITTGMVTENRRNEFGAAGVMFTMPFISRDGFFEAEREEAIPPERLTDVIALYTVHELGHFLNHYRDYYDHRNCIMVPANDLNYYRWYRERKEKKCGLKHEKLKRL